MVGRWAPDSAWGPGDGGLEADVLWLKQQQGESRLTGITCDTQPHSLCRTGLQGKGLVEALLPTAHQSLWAVGRRGKEGAA